MQDFQICAADGKENFFYVHLTLYSNELWSTCKKLFLNKGTINSVTLCEKEKEDEFIDNCTFNNLCNNNLF